MLLKSTSSNPKPPNGPNFANREGSSEDPQAAIDLPQKLPLANITFSKYKKINKYCDHIMTQYAKN